MSESVNEVDGKRRSDRGRGTDSVKVEVKEEGEEWSEGKAQQSGKGEEEGGKRHHAGGKKSIMTPL